MVKKQTEASGPLAGLKVVEFTGLGPAPFACMLLSDMGANVVRIDRKGKAGLTDLVRQGGPTDITGRGRRRVEFDLKDDADLNSALALIDVADVLVEGFRPGVMERMGLGPDALLARNPRLVYGRMTGWGQDGPLARTAGHDINYIAISGALAAIGPKAAPTQPLNLVGDYGGGALYLVTGILAARLEAVRSGKGQVVDAAMVDGVISLMTLFHSFQAEGRWDDTRRGANFLDGGAPFYRTFECADGKHVAVGPLEPQFYALLREKAGLNDPDFDQQYDARNWPAMHTKAEAIFKAKTRSEWCEIFDGSDACLSPVLTMTEAKSHPHVVARGSFVERDGVVQSAPAPRFSRTPSAIQSPPGSGAVSASAILEDWIKGGST